MIGSINANGSLSGLYPQYQTRPVTGVRPISGEEATAKASGVQCQTCKSRKYVDGSTEGDVSFQSPGHISPQSSAAVVASHEQEHVANARQEGAKEGNRLISASVSLKMSVCPECGRSYVSGGTTNTTIAYNEDNPYEKARKTIEGSFLAGMNFDQAA